jgi:hypothetical protein
VEGTEPGGKIWKEALIAERQAPERNQRLNAAFVGVESHFVYTKSSAFFIEVLRERLGKVHVFPSDWRWIHLPLKKRWDLIVFWQHFPEPWEIEALGAGSIVLVPMLDNCPREKDFWARYVGCRVLCFSRALAELLQGFGLMVFTVQYFPPVPAAGVDWEGPGLKAFFWPRKQEVSWSQVKPLLAGNRLTGVHLHITKNVSEVHLGITEEEERAFAISTSSWFDSAEDYLKLLRQHQVFIASRREEGIGLSFLEALGLGMAVIAPDNPTMNEYICSGFNGYLYDPENPVAPSLENAKTWAEEARRLCCQGREQWLHSIPGMINFLISPGPSRRIPNHDARVTRRMVEAWPGYVQYSIWKGLLSVKRFVFPRWKSAARKNVQIRD